MVSSPNILPTGFDRTPQQVVKEAVADWSGSEKEAASASVCELDSQQLKQSVVWEDVASCIECDRSRFIAALSDWTTEQRYKFVPMLKDFLQRKPSELESLGWVPSKLLVKALAA